MNSREWNRAVEADKITKDDKNLSLVLEDSSRDFDLIREQLIDAGFRLNISSG